MLRRPVPHPRAGGARRAGADEVRVRDGLLNAPSQGRARTAVVSRSGRALGRAEFTALLAMSMALAALGIDLMLPAFAAVRGEFGLPADSTAVAGLVTAYFLGLAGGQLIYGPIADRFGRRPTIFAAYVIYGIGALASALAPSLTLLFVARLVWGFGAAGPRVITLAVIRDTFVGDRMSRAMSFVMAVFILVPVVAPTLGALLVAVVSWRWLFVACAVAVGAVALWHTRMPETLREDNRVELRFRPLLEAVRFILSDRRTVGYTAAMTALYGSFIGYLGSSEIIFGDTYGRPEDFPLIFGGLAAVMGVAMLVNARAVSTFGTRRLSHVVLVTYVALSATLAAVAWASDGRPDLWLFVVLLSSLFASHALLVPNFNTIAMMPMGKVAGTASSVMGAAQIAIGALLGAGIDRAFDGTVAPLAYGFLTYGVVAALLVVWAERGRLFAPLTDPAALELPVSAES